MEKMETWNSVVRPIMNHSEKMTRKMSGLVTIPFMIEFLVGSTWKLGKLEEIQSTHDSLQPNSKESELKTNELRHAIAETHCRSIIKLSI